MTNRETLRKPEVPTTPAEDLQKILAAIMAATGSQLSTVEIIKDPNEAIKAILALRRVHEPTPLAGRYGEKLEPLSPYTSEKALMTSRLEFTIEYLIAFFETGQIGEPLSLEEKTILHEILANFKSNDEGIAQVKKLEESTQHDLNALIRWFKTQIPEPLSIKIIAYPHWGLTSEDANNYAYTIMLKGAIEEVISPKMQIVVKALTSFSSENLAENNQVQALFAAVGSFIISAIDDLNTHVYEGKLGGATGGLVGHKFLFPRYDWQKFSHDVLADLGLKKQIVTSQIASPESFLACMDKLKEMSLILHALNGLIWDLISDKDIHQKDTGRDGSSAMPNKINPLFTENGIGNIHMFAGVIDTMISQLASSIMQRDLTGSTTIRNEGTVDGFLLLAIESITKGLNVIEISNTISLTPITEAKIQSLLSVLKNTEFGDIDLQNMNLNATIMPLLSTLEDLALTHKDQPVLASTHGQPATPVTAGKIFAVMHSRIHSFIKQTEVVNADNLFDSDGIQLMTQLNTSSRLALLFGDILRDLGYYLKRNIISFNTQNSHENQIQLKEYRILASLRAEFHYTHERLRAIGNSVPTSFDLKSCHTKAIYLHTELAELILQAHEILVRLHIDTEAMNEELDENWAVVAELYQLVLRQHGYVHAYDTLASLCKGKEVTKESLHTWIDCKEQGFPENVRDLLKTITPANCTGYSAEVVDLYFESIAT
jgi:adenylosuccinate lyase